MEEDNIYNTDTDTEVDETYDAADEFIRDIITTVQNTSPDQHILNNFINKITNLILNSEITPVINHKNIAVINHKNIAVNSDNVYSKELNDHLDKIGIVLSNLFKKYIYNPFKLHNYNHNIPYYDNHSKMITIYKSYALSLYNKIKDKYLKENEYENDSILSSDNMVLYISISNGYPRFSAKHVSILKLKNAIFNFLNHNQLPIIDYLLCKSDNLNYHIVLNKGGMFKNINPSIILYYFINNLLSISKRIHKKVRHNLRSDIIKKRTTITRQGDEVIISLRI